MGRFWDDARKNPASLGCSRCADFGLCGGIHTATDTFDCTTYCCDGKHGCTLVCPRNSSFVDRVREIRGFDLDQLDRVSPAPYPSYPSSLPLIYRKGSRQLAFKPEAAAVSLYQLIDRGGSEARFRSREQLLDYFGLHASTRLVASGTDQDPPLERWWELGEGRRNLLRQLRELGIEAITAPNFSVFSDVPRWDNFHSMKRIAICWREMIEEGLPCALHVNARSPRDWERWTSFVRSREEVDAIAYEFATGASVRINYHVEELCHLADRVQRPLTLMVRGALSALPKLRESFARVTMLDSTTYMRTVNRKKAVVREKGPPSWVDAPDRPQVDLDALITHNYLAMLKAASPSIRE